MSIERISIERQTVVEDSANNGLIRQFSSAQSLLLCNWSATGDPSSSNDGTQGYSVGSFWLDTTNDNLWACMDNTTNAAVWRKLNNSSGDEFEEFSSLSSSTTTSTSNQTKLTSVTAVKPTGKYIVMAEARVRSGTANSEFGVTIQIDGVTQHAELVRSQIRTNNTANSHYLEFFIITFASATTHTLTMLYRAVGSSNTITINNARFLIWKVS